MYFFVSPEISNNKPGVDAPQNLNDLEQKIRAACGLVTQDLLQNVGRECVKKRLKCLKIGG